LGGEADIASIWPWWVMVGETPVVIVPDRVQKLDEVGCDMEFAPVDALNFDSVMKENYRWRK
jgi:hypothetical protein